jgi:hypothetical protein
VSYWMTAKIHCQKCGDEHGMSGLLDGLLEIWKGIGYDDYEGIHCPMCGNNVEVTE